MSIDRGRLDAMTLVAEVEHRIKTVSQPQKMLCVND